MSSRRIVEIVRGSLLRGACSILIVAGILLASPSAQAACGDPIESSATSSLTLPFSLQPNSMSDLAAPNPSIVGLWHVMYMWQGQLFYEALDEWHSDGTEFENARVAPAKGNICLGTWRPTTSGRVRLSHIGWTFAADGSSTGFFTITQVNTLDPTGATYTGKFHYTRYDIDGNLMFQLWGSQTATRIVVK